ncbi:MAG TPA: helicase-related protein, partial [Mycobacteriales bacterium]
ASVRDRSRVRTLLMADPAEADVRYLSPATLDLHDECADGDVPVLVTPGPAEAAAQRCPSCGHDDAVRFIGSSVATLVSVALTQMFGTDLAAEPEKKTLVFTDSVQDAAHRAAFVEGRAFQFNLRSMIVRAIGAGPTSLATVAERLSGDLGEADLYAVTPPDFPRRLGLEGEWLRHPPQGLRRTLANRLAFQAHLEFGLRSRLGRTLELTGAVAADIDVDLARLAALAREIHQNLPEQAVGELPDVEAYQPWLLGLVERLRTTGGIHHQWLRRYVERDGDRYPIWGGSPRGMQKFPRGMAAPTFLTTGRSKHFTALAPAGEAPTWLTDWTGRCLGVPARGAKSLLLRVCEALAGDEVGALVRRTSNSGAAIYGLDPARISLHLVDTDELAAGGARLRCTVCQHLQPTTAHRQAVWDDAPCPRWRCTGRLRPDPAPPENFYRTMYLSRRVRRIVTQEHTGLLDRPSREDVETRFKAGTSPIDPNVLTCTPTLELGIDIGELGVVTLASLPRATANYLQRVGRAGRSSGNSLVLATVPSEPRDLYYFAEPRHLIDGEVTPPGAYLDATELLHRQFLAYCLDRVAAGELGPQQSPPWKIGPLVRRGLEPSGWMRRFLDAIHADAAGLAGGFLDLFGEHLDEQSRQDVRAFAAGGIEVVVSQAFADWRRREADLTDRILRLGKAITELEDQGHLDDAQREDRRRWLGELRAVRLLHHTLVNESVLTGLELLGLLPNYTLVDDSTVLDVTLWWTSDEGGKEYQSAEYSYARGSMTAVTELAPGAAFYVRGQRIRVDAVDIGPTD